MKQNFNRTKFIRARVTEYEYKEFMKYARLHRLKLSEFIRKLLEYYKQQYESK